MPHQLPRDEDAANAFGEMQMIVDDTPDTGEGGRFQFRSDFAWDVQNTYRRAVEGDASVLYEDEYDTLEKIRTACVRDAQKAVARWTAEDSASTFDAATGQGGHAARRPRGYAAKFYAETYGAEPRKPEAPTDANLAECFRHCARVPRRGEYPAIRQILLDEYGVGII